MNIQFGLMTYFSIVKTYYIQNNYEMGFAIWKYKFFHPNVKIIKI